jgi:hypothetical protein
MPEGYFNPWRDAAQRACRTCRHAIGTPDGGISGARGTDWSSCSLAGGSEGRRGRMNAAQLCEARTLNDHVLRHLNERRTGVVLD